MLEKLTADMVLLNGKVITVDGYFSIAQAVAIKDGKFLAVGSDTKIKLLIGKHTQVFNLYSKTVVPGFIDSHLHMKWTGLNLNKINLRKISSIEDIVKAVEKKVKETPKGEWIQGFG